MRFVAGRAAGPGLPGWDGAVGLVECAACGAGLSRSVVLAEDGGRLISLGRDCARRSLGGTPRLRARALDAQVSADRLARPHRARIAAALAAGAEPDARVATWLAGPGWDERHSTPADAAASWLAGQEASREHPLLLARAAAELELQSQPILDRPGVRDALAAWRAEGQVYPLGGHARALVREGLAVTDKTGHAPTTIRLTRDGQELLEETA